MIRERIAEIDPDVVCYTEVVRAIVPEGYRIEADPDYGYPNDGTRRKVLLWSKLPWADASLAAGTGMPSGRFASGITGGIRFVGVCIPWRDAHVRTGRRDRGPWEDHLSYCRELGRIFTAFENDDTPTCVLGDYNQRIPCRSQPVEVARALDESFPLSYQIASRGMVDAEGHHLIDHLAASPGLGIEITAIVSRFSSDGTRLSDHVGIEALLDARKLL